LICEFIDSEKLEDVLDSMPKVVRMLDMFGSKSIDGDDLTILAVYFVYSIKYDQPYRITFNFIEFLIPDEVRLNKLESLINTYCEKLNLGYFIFTKHGLVSRDLISRKDKYIEVLKNVSQTLRDNGRKNCILYGTLLGAVRNNSFIPYDDDVDLCVFSNATVIDDVILDRNEIVDILRINGFEVIYEPTNFWNIHVYSVENELTIDLFPIFIFGEKVILHMEEMKFREIPLSIIEPFSLVKLYDEEFFAPAKPEEFLYERYGNNWHISDRFFEFPYKISTNSFLSNDKVLIINDENNVTEIENNEDFFVSDVIEDVLWIDKPDWMDVLALRHRRGEFSDEMCDRIFHFIRDGFIVIPNAVDLETVHKVNEEINSKWEYPPKDLFIETFEPDSKINVIPADIEYKTGRTKMLDVYAHSDIVRSAINNEPTRQFLTAIFGDAPKAFQSLNFWFGSGQPIHKDSAYVKIDKEPTKFAASWIALEDIVVGSGELEYFVGSHKAPPYLFGGKNKWLESNPSEHNDFLISLYRDATLYNQTHQKFIARAGDVLIWHADLSHGGTKVIKNNTTRLSLVTHFTPKSSSPYFYRKRRFIEKDDGDMVFVSQYSDIN
jgi:hypothetical protein